MAATPGVTILVNDVCYVELTWENLCGCRCLLLLILSDVCVCWTFFLPWSAPHVFDITVTRLPSLSGEMENVREQSRETSSFPTSDGMRNTLAGWSLCWRHSVGAEQRVEAMKDHQLCVRNITLLLVLFNIFTQIVKHSAHTLHFLSQWNNQVLFLQISSLDEGKCLNYLEHLCDKFVQ